MNVLLKTSGRFLKATLNFHCYIKVCHEKHPRANYVRPLIQTAIVPPKKLASRTRVSCKIPIVTICARFAGICAGCASICARFAGICFHVFPRNRLYEKREGAGSPKRTRDWQISATKHPRDTNSCNESRSRKIFQTKCFSLWV